MGDMGYPIFTPHIGKNPPYETSNFRPQYNPTSAPSVEALISRALLWEEAHMSQVDPSDSPTALFCALETALGRGDFYRAAELRDQLASLGFKISIQAPKGKRNATVSQVRVTQPTPA